MASWRRPAGASGTIQTWLDGRGAPIADFTPARPNLSETFSLPTYTGPATPTPISLFVLGRPEVSSNGTIRVPALSAEVGTVVFIAGVVRGAGPAVYGSGVLRSRRSAVTLIIKPAAKARKALAQYKHLRLQLGVEFLAAGAQLPGRSRSS